MHMSWIDQGNLYAVKERLIASPLLPNGAPKRLDRWPFATPGQATSREADVFFQKNATGKEAFRITDVQTAGGGPPLSRSDWARFGATLETVGPR
jgi:hypothetical protein